MRTNIIEEARSLCDQIAGEISEDGNEARGSIEIVTVLVNEVKRLREVGTFRVGQFALFQDQDLYSGKDVIVIQKDGGEGGHFDPVAVECAISNFFNANL